jgi:hypothetical protein
MGAWGYKSYESDHVMDAIPYSYQEWKSPTTKEMDKTLGKVFSPSKSIGEKYELREVRLGTIVYFLENSDYQYPVIAHKYLRQALDYARTLKEDKVYLDDWKNPTARKNRLNKEIKLIKEAQKN